MYNIPQSQDCDLFVAILIQDPTSQGLRQLIQAFCDMTGYTVQVLPSPKMVPVEIIKPMYGECNNHDDLKIIRFKQFEFGPAVKLSTEPPRIKKQVRVNNC